MNLNYDIESAPKDGFPILTDVGIVRWENEFPYMNRWIACKSNGEAFEHDVEGDSCRFTMNPTMWMELPKELISAMSTKLDQELGLWDSPDTSEVCRYCGGDCNKDQNNSCDGYLGDIDCLYH